VVAVNLFDGILHHRLEDVREALAVDPDVPFVQADARAREPVKQVLIRLVEHALVTAAARLRATPPPSPSPSGR
jgi:hypothetical protein